MSSNAAQVEKEMRMYGMAKWAAVTGAASQAGDLCVEAIKERTPVDTQAAQSSIAHDIIKLGPWVFKIGTYGKDVTNPKTGESTLRYLDCLEYGGPCPKGQTRHANMMFRSGSISSKEAMDNLLASLF